MRPTQFFRLDMTDMDATVTWATVEGDHVTGRVSHYPDGSYRITYAGLGVKAPRYVHYTTREAAASSLHDLREAAGTEQILPSGLTRLQEAVLRGEAAVQAGATTRDIAAAELGIAPVNFAQVLYSLLSDPHAKAFAPVAVAKATIDRDRRRSTLPGRRRATPVPLAS